MENMPLITRLVPKSVVINWEGGTHLCKFDAGSRSIEKKITLFHQFYGAYFFPF